MNRKGKARKSPQQQKIRQEHIMAVLGEIAQVTSALIMLLGVLYIADAVRHRWTLLTIALLGILLNLALSGVAWLRRRYAACACALAIVLAVAALIAYLLL